jgi:hypothetical protein
VVTLCLEEQINHNHRLQIYFQRPVATTIF